MTSGLRLAYQVPNHPDCYLKSRWLSNHFDHIKPRELLWCPSYIREHCPSEVFLNTSFPTSHADLQLNFISPVTTWPKATFTGSCPSPIYSQIFHRIGFTSIVTISWEIAYVYVWKLSSQTRAFRQDSLCTYLWRLHPSLTTRRLVHLQTTLTVTRAPYLHDSCIAASLSLYSGSFSISYCKSSIIAFRYE